MSTPIRTHLSQYKARFKEVAFFCTSDSGSNGHTFQDMERLCEKKPLAMLEVQAEKVSYEKFTGEIEEFIHEITRREVEP